MGYDTNFFNNEWYSSSNEDTKNANNVEKFILNKEKVMEILNDKNNLSRLVENISGIPSPRDIEIKNGVSVSTYDRASEAIKVVTNGTEITNDHEGANSGGVIPNGLGVEYGNNFTTDGGVKISTAAMAFVNIKGENTIGGYASASTKITKGIKEYDVEAKIGGTIDREGKPNAAINIKFGF